jgi:hypothetical protein
MRECNKCHISKPLKEFHISPHQSEGRRTVCAACIRAWNRAHVRKPAEQRAAEKAARDKTDRIAGMRVCNKCNISKPLTDYHRHPHCKDGRKGTCKACVSGWGNNYREVNAETLRVKKKAYTQTESGKEAERRGWRKYRAKPENRKAHNERVGVRAKVRRRVDPVFRQKKMDLARKHYVKRYGPRVALEALFDSQLGRCANPHCQRSLKAGCHVDHIMPVALGGDEDLRNLQFLCPDCNFRKNKLHPDEWERLERERAA